MNKAAIAGTGSKARTLHPIRAESSENQPRFAPTSTTSPPLAQQRAVRRCQYAVYRGSCTPSSCTPLLTSLTSAAPVAIRNGGEVLVHCGRGGSMWSRGTTAPAAPRSQRMRKLDDGHNGAGEVLNGHGDDVH